MMDDLNRGGTGNRVVDAMKPGLREYVEGQLKSVDLRAGHVLVEAGRPSNELWFPCGTATVAVAIETADGQQTDVAFLGRESVVSACAANDAPAYATIYVLFPGKFLHLAIDGADGDGQEERDLSAHLALYTDCFIIELLQSIACRACHTVDQRIARLLLQQKARFGLSAFPVTQGQMAQMLGLGRTFVNQAIGRLRKAGAVGSRRGTITIEDEALLMATSCGCSRQLDRYFERLLL